MMRRWSKVASLVVAGLGATAACGGEPSAGSPSWRGSVDTAGAVVTVTNPAAPLFERGAVVLEAVWRQDASRETEEWQEPRALAIAGHSIFVLDQSAARIHRLDAATGDPVGSFGRSGGGPGELEDPTDIAATGDSLVVLDAGKKSLDVFDQDGRFRGSRRLEFIAFGMDALGADRLLIQAFGAAEPQVVVEVDGAFRPLPLAPSGQPADSAGAKACTRLSVIEERIVQLDCSVPRLGFFNQEGQLRRIVRVDRARVERPAASLDAFVEEAASVMNASGMGTELIARMVADLREDHRWLRGMRDVRHDAERGLFALREQDEEDFSPDGGRLHVFTAGGVYLADIGLDRAWWDWDFLDGDLVALTRDPDLGLVTLVRFALPLPADLSAPDF